MAKGKRSKKKVWVPFEERTTEDLQKFLKSEEERKAKVQASADQGLGTGYALVVKYIDKELEKIRGIIAARKD